jgi:hypothetical protein
VAGDAYFDAARARLRGALAARAQSAGPRAQSAVLLVGDGMVRPADTIIVRNTHTTGD